jgi:Ca2+-binding EF-hand superfamily protein
MSKRIGKSEDVMTHISRVGAALVVFSLSTVAWAQSDKAQVHEMLSRADSNGDGQLTRKELEKYRSKTLERLDRTKDGVVNSKDRPPRPFNKRFDEAFSRIVEEFDANNDGKVTRKEFVQGPTTGFDAADLDGNDILSAEEIENLTPSDS